MSEALLVVKPGSYSTIQDQGRYGYQDLGVPVSGALDQVAARSANLLLGNPESAAVLECTVIGPSLAVLRETDLSVTGAEMDVKLNHAPIAPWSRFRVRPGDLLHLRQVVTGCRTYLGISGGFDVPVIMNSRSTCVAGEFGGLHGRPLQKGDVLPGGDEPLLPRGLSLPAALIPGVKTDPIVLRVVPGPQDGLFRQKGLDTFLGSEYTISAKANRMGYRLEGPGVERDPEAEQSIISEPSLPGNIQVPADGQPIILLVEQTVGGYTKIATVISSDLPLIAQSLPGGTVRFQPVSVDDARHALQKQERRMQEIQDFLTEQAK